ncbi:hypothetical protein [Streptomyces sp. NPDC002994]|uniref:hypothetical protein n=1 Tax=Streptomyces sp. NPDC002994 TaxID=3154441 RepID=UPI0033A46819
MSSTQVPAIPFKTPRWARDPYRFHGPEDFDQLDAAPDPEQRLPFVLAASDKRRLDLYAALTTTGIAPLPGDLEAIDVLSKLDDTTIRTVLRWITSP